MVEVYIVLQHKVQIHVSALDNGHLQVVHEILSRQLYEAYMVFMFIGPCIIVIAEE